MKSIFLVKICALLAMLMVFSCTPQKKLVYFQGDLPPAIPAGKDTFSFKLQPGDIVAIYIQNINPEAFPYLQAEMQPGDNRNAYERGYVIDREGNVELLLIGKVQLAGLNLFDAKVLLNEKFENYIANPVITIKRLDFRITMLGEVALPGTYSVSNERMRFTEAIGLAGGLTSFGNPKKVKLIRLNQQESVSFEVDLTTTEVFDPELLYVKPNDIIYVEPFRRKALSNLNPTLSAISTLVSITVLVLTVAVNLK
ncbi:MAG: polysaccharide biosynthesis/export family protein [Bacteroidia bacterium]